MYRGRRHLQPKIPQISFELETTLSGTMYGMFFKDCVMVGGNQAFIFFSDAMTNILGDVIEVSFDGTFYSVPKQFTSCGQYLSLLINTSSQLYIVF